MRPMKKKECGQLKNIYEETNGLTANILGVIKTRWVNIGNFIRDKYMIISAVGGRRMKEE